VNAPRTAEELARQPVKDARENDFLAIAQRKPLRGAAPRDSMSASTVPPPFRFLDLPKELRLMVYDLLPNQTERIQFCSKKETKKGSLTLITTCVPTAILCTCRQIRNEAEHIVRTRANQYLQSSCLESPAPRIEMNAMALKSLNFDWLTEHLCNTYVAVLNPGHADEQELHSEDTEEEDWGDVSDDDRYIPPPTLQYLFANWSNTLAVRGFELCDGTREEGDYYLERFLRRALQTLLYQSRKSRPAETVPGQSGNGTKFSDYPHGPSLEIALRATSDEERMLVSDEVDGFVMEWSKVGSRTGVSTILHLLRVDANDAEEQKAWHWTLYSGAMGAFDYARLDERIQFCDCIRFSAEHAFDVEQKDVYDRLWMQGEWF
jgi:hypothetical protein